jgi:hypothetical protein
MVVNRLNEQHFDAMGLTTKLNFTANNRKELIKAVLLHIGVFVSLVDIASQQI